MSTPIDTYRQLPDEDLLHKYRATGDLEILGVLYERYIELVFGTCLKYLKQAHDSEDAAMAIFESLVTKLKSHDVKQFRGWLFVLTRNHCLQILRKQKPALTRVYEDVLVHLEHEEHPDDRMIIEHRENGLLDCLGKLPDLQKRSIQLFYYDAKSYDEIANELSVNKDRVRSYIQNGRRNLKICMEKNNESATAK